MYVMYNIAVIATDVVSKILTFLKEKLLEMSSNGRILNQAISKGFQVSNQVNTGTWTQP